MSMGFYAFYSVFTVVCLWWNRSSESDEVRTPIPNGRPRAYTVDYTGKYTRCVFYFTTDINEFATNMNCLLKH